MSTDALRVTVVTLFPDAFESFLGAGILGKAVDQGLVKIDFVNPREFTSDKHRTVDDSPYGGGPGMLMKPEPVVAAIESVTSAKSHRVLLAPVAKALTQKKVEELARREHLVFVCGRYEGVDERVCETCIDERVSLGDYVLNGGEVAAMTVIEAVTRVLPGVLGASESAQEDSFSNGLLEFPQYTRPNNFREKHVPEVLLSGNHQEIAAWRRKESLSRTARFRPDLLGQVDAPDNPLGQLAKRTYVVLVHHPVRDKLGETVTTSVTNLDLHDIARAASTFGFGGYFVATPISAQREMVERIASKWSRGGGADGRDGRADALKPVHAVASIEEALEKISAEGEPFVLATAANPSRVPGVKMVNSAEVQSLSETHEGPLVILLGTGWGLSDESIRQANRVLNPIHGFGISNHLSVRSAFAVIADRLFGRRG